MSRSKTNKTAAVVSAQRSRAVEKKPTAVSRLCKPGSWGRSCKLALGGLGTIIALMGGLWGLDRHWLPREIHDLAMAQTEKAVDKITNQLGVMGLQQQEFYWKRREQDLKAEMRTRPNDRALREDYEYAIQERRRVEDEVRKIQNPKK